MARGRNVLQDWAQAAVLMRDLLRKADKNLERGRPLTPEMVSDRRVLIQAFKDARPGLDAKIVELLDSAADSLRRAYVGE